jgi:hypothetical protein
VSKPLVAWLVLFGHFAVSNSPAAPGVLRAVKAASPGTALLRNGGFEEAASGKPERWNAAPGGLALAPGEGRGASQALACEATNTTSWTGASQTLELGRTNPLPLVVRGWSKALDVSGSPNSGYSLYVDILYQDGTPLWGQTANFRTGTHDWQYRELLILPERPVKSLTLHCIFRGHSGKAWFDDITLEEIRTGGDSLVFEGTPIALRTVSKPPRGMADGAGAARRTQKLVTRDGLELKASGQGVSSLRLGGKELAADAPSGFLVRDVAAGSDYYGISGGESAELSLKLAATYRAEANHLAVMGRLSDSSGKDRAVSLLFALPVDATGWDWGDDIGRPRRISGTGEFANTVAVGCGATGTMSLYPLAAVYSQKEGLGLGLDMAQAAQYRLVYHAGTKQLFIAFDFALVPDTLRSPGAADFRFVLFRFDPEWGFRAAFQKFTQIFPEHFRVRSHDQGIWMPFTDVGTVEQWQDFGFKYHEGNNHVPWDDAHNVLSFRYTEPMTWWMRMEKGRPRTVAEALRIRDRLAANGGGSEHSMAQVSQVAGMQDDADQPALSFRDTPWCDGAVWSLNPNPHLPAPASAPGATNREPLHNGATVYWNDALKESLYGPRANGRLDGEYLDSLEGYVTADLNFRREHFRHTTVPLTFATDTKQPALFKGLAVFEFTKWLSADLHRMGKLMFANGVPYRLGFLCPWLDVLGTETDWLQDGKYHPASQAQMRLWRTLSGAKPYLLLMNTDYDAFGPELVEKYFQRSLAYGFFPGMFSHNAADNPYWQSPKWYNRDRPLFKKYLPLVKLIAEAGWEPVTYARCNNGTVCVERFGPGPNGAVYLTVFNDAQVPQSCSLRVDAKRLGLAGSFGVRELVSGIAVAGQPIGPISLDPEQTVVLELTSHPTQ